MNNSENRDRSRESPKRSFGPRGSLKSFNQCSHSYSRKYNNLQIDGKVAEMFGLFFSFKNHYTCILYMYMCIRIYTWTCMYT